MSGSKQVFQTSSRLRWRAFQWTARVVLLCLILMVPVVLITLARGLRPGLPALTGEDSLLRTNAHPVIPAGLNNKELKKYKGFNEYLKARQHLRQLTDSCRVKTNTQRIRAAFYVDWDPQSFYSLQENANRLNTVIPEWFFLDPVKDTLVTRIDTAALASMKKAGMKILPLLNNVNIHDENGNFDGNLLHRILHDPAKKAKLINQLVQTLKANNFQGINIDFEDFREKGDEPVIAFQQALYNRLHTEGLLVTQDIMANNSDFNITELSKYNDYMFLMAYDEHYSESVPGPVSSQRWIEKMLDETAANIPSDKIILCIAGYGYDWPEGREATTITYQQALAKAKQYNATIDFNNDTYSSHYQYTDADGLKHEVYFTDAAGNFNTIRFADEYGTAGTALWRLGSEDARLWSFYNKPLDNESLAAHPFNYQSLEQVKAVVERPDYIGDGEILNVISAPEQGQIKIDIDSTENMIAEQRYVSMPSRYVIQKYGKVNKQVVLTFDDGPDPVYTPQILDILKKEKVPAAFFVVGIEAETNLPLLRRIYREGHEIGNHTFTHPNIAAVSADRAATEMETTRLLIEAVTGHSTVLFRAPYNADAEPSTDVELRPVALSKQQHYYTVGESIDPEDWETPINADTIYNRVVRQYEANPDKGIILLHDAGGDRTATVEALPRIIHYFKNKNIQFTTVAGLLHTNKETIMPAVHSGWIGLNGSIFEAGYWLQYLMTTAFWFAILLGLGRIALLGIMAVVQKIRKRKAVNLAFNEQSLPEVTILVPAYNEEITAVKTISNLLMQDYPAYSILFIDDGSKDKTFEKVKMAFGSEPRVRMISKPNGGKASALNTSVQEATTEMVVCIDADTQLRPDAIRRLVEAMLRKPFTGAAAGNVKVGNARTLLTRWQSIEYTTSQNFDRRALELVNAITVVPGAIGIFRKEAIEKAGGFTSDTLAEDCDLTIRMLRQGYTVVNCPDAIAVTEAPETLRQFMKQRFRWSYGVMQAFWKNRQALFNTKQKGLGFVAMPNILFFQILLPLLAPLADLVLISSLIWNRHHPDSLEKIGLYYLVFLAVDLLVGAIAFAFENEKPWKLIWLLPQRFIYRQLMYIILFKSIRKAIKGESQGWGVLQRTGSVQAITSPT